jgi:peroxiredoxin
MMELEALQEIDSEVRSLGARMLIITPELERYTRPVHRKLQLTFDVLTDLHLKTAEQFGLVFTWGVTCATSTNLSEVLWTGFMMNRNTGCRCPHVT